MFGFSSSKKARLEKKYQQLLDKAYRLSHSDRKQSDMVTAEAEQVRKQLDALESTK